jgi:P-type E1-E2 ATPase
MDPLRPGIKDAVLQCHKSGVNVRMVTGDNIDTAIAISKEAGIIG